MRCVSVCSNVNVYSGSDACMADCSGFAKFSDQFLQGFNVLVFQNRRDQFALFGIASCNADVLLKFPFSALCIPSRPSAVAVSAGGVFVSACAEMVGGKSGSSFSGDVVHLNLHADGLLFQVFNLSFCFNVHNVFLRNFGLCLGSSALQRCPPDTRTPFVVPILTLNGGDSKRLNLQKMRSKDCVEYTLAILAIVW